MVLVLVIGHWSLPVSALDNPEQKASGAIKDYIATKNPGWLRDEINLTFKFAEKIFADLEKLPEGACFKVLEGYAEFKPAGNVIFPLEVTVDGGARKVFLRAKVEVFKNVVAAAKTIKRGKRLEASDFKVEERDVALLPQKYFVEPYSLVNKEAKISIPSNSTIFEWMVGDPPVIRSGSEVTVLISSPGLTVKTRGESLSDGYLDEEIKVRRKESKKIIAGKVISPNEVEVKM